MFQMQLEGLSLQEQLVQIEIEIERYEKALNDKAVPEMAKDRVIKPGLQLLKYAKFGVKKLLQVD